MDEMFARTSSLPPVCAPSRNISRYMLTLVTMPASFARPSARLRRDRRYPSAIAATKLRIKVIMAVPVFANRAKLVIIPVGNQLPRAFLGSIATDSHGANSNKRS